jgi:sialic acid synthase SpsE
MMPHIVIAGRRVGPGEPCYIIAEAGSNHDQSFEQALALIDAASAAGADAVKFQAIKYDALWVPALQTAEHRAFYRAVELPEEWLPELARAAQSRGLHFLCSPTYLESVRLIDAAGAPAFKIASPQTVGDPPLLRAVAATGKPAIVSTGYADMARIDRAVQVLETAGCRAFALLHCVAEYPVAAARVNLRAIDTLSQRFNRPVGLSDHSDGIHIAPAAVALGACIVEKHFTTDRRRQGPDHPFALEPGELARMIAHIHEVEQALGDGARAQNSTREREQIEALTVRVVAGADIAAGTPVTRDVVVFRRAPAGLTADEFEALAEPVAAEQIPAGTPIVASMIAWRRS